ncbi:MAG: LTA synthase family protein [Bacilli bacterium]
MIEKKKKKVLTKKKQKKEKKKLRKHLKEKFSLENIKAYSKHMIKTTKYIILDNKLVFIYILGAVINGMILRGFTIGSPFNLRPILADLVVSLIFASFYFFIKKKYRFTYLMTISIISLIVCISNIVYYFYYSSFISITFFSFALANHETGESNVVGDLIKPQFFIFLWLPIVLYIVNRREKKKNLEDQTFKRVTRKTIFRTLYTWVLIFFIIFLSTLKPVDFSRLYSQWNREYLVSRFGVYMYQINDIVKSIEPKMATLFGKDKAYKEINEYYEEEENTKQTNEYTNIFKGKNVIAVHAESMQNVLIDLKIGGKEITPNLNKLTKEGLYFDNFYSQVSFGTSSDTEFTYATSLLPVSSGTVFINHSDKEYVSFYKLLKDKGYYTFSMHANTGDFWNRNIMHENLGYDKFYDKSSYEIDEEIGFGLSDESFIKQSVEYIKQINKENKKFYGTLITLSNHTPFDYNELYGDDLDVTMTKDGVEYPYMKDTKLGNYFISAHYADKQLGLLVSELEKAGILEDTIIVIYGDHDARISTSLWNKFYNYDYKTDGILDEDDPNYKELDYYWQELNRKVPLIIWSSDEEIQSEYGKTISTAMGMYDVAPTLGNMLGVYNEYALGSDIMNKKDNLVAFPNGNFVTNYVYYNDNKEEYKLLKNVPLSDDYITKNKEKTKKFIDISNDIIVYNYFENKFSTKYEEEK